jgi:hypothetical protein
VALGDPYADPDELAERLGQSDDGTFERLLVAASWAVEVFTRRQFNKATAATARRFRALDCERVAVDDFYTLTDLAVVVDGTAWDVTQYIDPRPWNGAVAGQVGWPYSDLFAIGRQWPWSRRALITVTARWGWVAVPSGIVEATLDAAEAMYAGRFAMEGGKSIRSETIGGYSVSFATPSTDDTPPEMLRALPYRRKVFGVA